MNKKEFQEMISLMEQSGLDVKLCDTPVPYFPSGVPAGFPEAPDDYDGEYVMVPKDFLKMCDYIVKVRGYSMKDAGIEDGDDVMVKYCDYYDDGDVVVALLDGDSTLKAYYRDENDEAWLMPDNDDFPPFRVSDYSTAYILGRVTGVKKSAPRTKFSTLRRRLQEAKEQQQRVVTDQMVTDAVTQVLADIKNGRMWFAVYRVLVDVGYLKAGDYEGLKTKMDLLFPDNDFAINPRDISRMDILSFSKRVSLWNSENAPVTGKRYRDYLRLATDLTALLNR
jgi:SOS-response transcriptional repressor LexA